MLLLLRHNRGAALTAAGAVAALTLLLVVALARSSPFLKAGSDESALNQERQLELQEAIQVVKDDVTALKAQLRETDETIAKKKVMRRRQEDAVDIAKKEEQRVVDDGKMKMAALQRKDQRIAEATHKVPRDGSMMSSTIAAAKRIWEENRAAAHKEVQKERKKLEHATSEVEAAQQVKRDLARRVSESQALVKQLVTELEAISQPAGQRLKPGPPAGDLLEEAKAAGPGGTQAALQAGSEGAQADQPEVPEAKDEAADDQQLAAGGEEAEEEANDNAEGLAADRAAQANGTGLGEAGTQATEAKPPAIAEAAGEADFDDDSGSGGEGKRARELVGASPERDAPALGNRSLAASVQRAKGLARVDSSGSDVPGTLSSPNALDAGEAGAKSDAEDRLPPAGSPQHDDSIRCRTSYICEGPSACRQSADKDLACMRSAAERRRRIVESARWAWKGYRENAFGYDELHPVSRQPETWFNLGLTLVDSLDTLWLMNLTEEYAEARDWVVDSMRVDVDMDVNLFETTIRILGGLLTMHNLTGEEVYLERASELGHRLLPAFETSTGIPLSDVNLRQQTARGPKWGSDSSTSEVTTLYLEFSYLSRLTGDSIFEQKASRVLEVFDKTPGRVQGLCPIMINPNNGNFKGNTYTLGARGDSYYEYLLKCWIISGRRQERCLRMFKETMRGVREQLLDKTSEVDGLVYVAELKRGRVEPKMDHLVCFLPGLLVLAHWHGVETSKEGEPSDLELAKSLMHTCYALYRDTPTGLAPEIVHFTKHTADYPKIHLPDVGNGHFEISQRDSHNLLRPETVESLYFLWLSTRDPKYREWAWLIFRAFEMHTRVPTGGYSSIDSVLEVPTSKSDKMESFWMAETLKYLYLIFQDQELLSLDAYVFNTEAHPLPIDVSLGLPSLLGPQKQELFQQL